MGTKRHIDRWVRKGIDNLKINPYSHGQLLFDKIAKAVQRVRPRIRYDIKNGIHKH